MLKQQKTPMLCELPSMFNNQVTKMLHYNKPLVASLHLPCV